MARNLLNDHTFQSRLEQVIWEYHTESISIRNIVKLLKKVRIKTNRHSVWLIINKLEAIMKKMYIK